MRKLLLKFKGWRYEDEVRLFACLEGENGEFSYFDFGEGLTLREVIVGGEVHRIQERERTEATRLAGPYPQREVVGRVLPSG